MTRSQPTRHAANTTIAVLTVPDKQSRTVPRVILLCVDRTYATSRRSSQRLHRELHRSRTGSQRDHPVRLYNRYYRRMNAGRIGLRVAATGGNKALPATDNHILTFRTDVGRSHLAAEPYRRFNTSSNSRERGKALVDQIPRSIDCHYLA